MRFLRSRLELLPTARCSLLGFSKAGWSVISALLRHPSVFWQAASWDAPLMIGGDFCEWLVNVANTDCWGLRASFLTCEAMRAHAPIDLLRAGGGVWAGERKRGPRAHTYLEREEIPRLGIFGFGMFGSQPCVGSRACSTGAF